MITCTYKYEDDRYYYWDDTDDDDEIKVNNLEKNK